MELSKNKAYSVLINYKNGDEVLDLAFGVWGNNRKISYGLTNHSVSVEVRKMVKFSGDEMIIKSNTNDKFTFKIINASDYKKFKGILFSENAPPIANDEEVQEYIMSQPRY
ncbi:hypothetical protein LGK95_12535 [Clostridium algoriphilum]|uniref:hypothetical protein n=1 Tax=Clostridium algoriphilum TaxID=198347 RepID=UPI001CF4CAC7|nr:hypothetical protein [Clostridium algoriphilum]MCB2294337.1 hypothetical protein [Clostridium algoriphilum]